ncbi:MAG: hypothetical protein ACI8RN_000446 [Glaciecola sp.]|jgi:hypothetical protein|uniref:DUF885 family protein n=1 Tax=Congregibacter sp. TaxID=2744308 RepID=UPI0039E700F7
MPIKKLITYAISALFLNLALSAIAADTGNAGGKAFSLLVDRYLEEVLGIGNLDAGAPPIQRGDSALREMTAQGFTQRIGTLKRFIADLERIDISTLEFDDEIDHRFLEGTLKADLLVAQKVQRWRQDPRIYFNNGPIAYGIGVDPRPRNDRAKDLINDLELLSVRLENAQLNLDQYIPRWIELTHQTLDGFRSLLVNDLPPFAERLEGAALQQALLSANASAVTALNTFQEFLRDDLPKMPLGDYRVGAEVFNGLQEHRYMFAEDDINLRRIARGDPGFTRVPGYHDWGWKQFEIVRHHLEVKARRINEQKTWLELLRSEKEDHFFAEQLVYKHLEATRATRDWVIDNDLVSIPWDDDDAIMEAADSSMWASQWWGFGPGVPPDAKTRKSAWRVIPVAPDWPDEVAEANLTEKDASFMYAIATHEVYPGHHLQSLYKQQNPRRLRRYLESYASNQAWCYYIEWELTPDPQYGWFPENKQAIYELETLRLKLWRFGRVIIDSGLNTDRMNYEDALELETDTIGFVREGGQINIDNITSRTGADYAAPTLAYFQWMLLREDYFKKMRTLDQKGTLKDFHDRVYNIGFLPVVLVRETLFHDLEEQFGS